MAKEEQTLSLQAALKLADNHYSENQYSDAENLCQQILRAYPEQPQALHLLGMLATKVGKYELSIDLIGRSVATEPNNAIANYNLGVALQELGRLDAAARSYRNAIAIKSDHFEAHNNLGIILLHFRHQEEAIASFRKALSIKPNYVEAYVNIGNTMQSLQNFDGAIVNYQKALVLQPGLAEAHNNLGVALQSQNRFEEAVIRFQNAITLRPTYADASDNKGVALLELGKLDEAVACHYQALLSKPESAPIHYNIGNVLLKLRRRDEAVEHYRKALMLNKNYAEAHNNLGLLFLETGLLANALESCHKVFMTPPYSGNARYLWQTAQLLAWQNYKIVIKALQFVEGEASKTVDVYSEELPKTSRASTEFAMLKYRLSTFRPHDSDKAFQKATAKLPAKRDEILVLNNNNGKQTKLPSLPDKVVALLHFGRSGTGLLHSLFDGHPEISTLPSIYLRGFFNEGVWDRLTSNGWRNIPKEFVDQFAVLFDANSPKSTPGSLTENSSYLGGKEGMTCVGQNRDESLSIDQDQFCTETLQLMTNFKEIDPKLFLLIVHAAFERVRGTKTNKHTTLYHIHNPSSFAKLNFLRYIPDVRLIMMVRDPLQSCESWIRFCFESGDYNRLSNRIMSMLLAIDQIGFRKQDSIGVRLEDLKKHPEITLKNLCNWLGVQDDPCLYEMTAQGKKWWGDPTSPDYNINREMPPFDDTSTRRPIGTIFSQRDQFILRTLFYPFYVRFGYQKPDATKFENDLKEIQPLVNEPMEFEKSMLERTKLNSDQFERSGPYLALHACLQDRWDVLSQFKDYPHMLQPLANIFD